MMTLDAETVAEAQTPFPAEKPSSKVWGWVVSVLLVVGLGVALWQLFPAWYLDTSPHVLLRPQNLANISRVPPDEEPESTRTQLLHLDTALETRISSGFQAVRLPLPVYKIGVGAVGHRRVASLQFGVEKAPRAVVEQQALTMVYTAFRMAPQLSEVDVWGVDRRDTRLRKGELVFTLAVRRDQFLLADARTSQARHLRQLGSVWHAHGRE